MATGRIPTSQREQRRVRRQALDELHQLAAAGDLGLDEALRIEAVAAAALHDVDTPPAAAAAPGPAVSRTAAAAALRRRH